MVLTETSREYQCESYFYAQKDIPHDHMINNKDVVTFAVFSTFGDKLAFGTSNGLTFIADVNFTDVISHHDAYNTVQQFDQYYNTYG